MSVNTNKPKTYIHNHLESLLNQKGYFVDIKHEQFPGNKKVRATTTVWAYNSVADAKKKVNPVGQAVAVCSINDQFVKTYGLTTALRRLYRDLVNKK